MAVPALTQVVSVVYSTSQALSFKPGAQSKVTLDSLVSVTYTFGLMQVMASSQSPPKTTLLLLVLRLELVLTAVGLLGSGLLLSL